MTRRPMSRHRDASCVLYVASCVLYVASLSCVLHVTGAASLMMSRTLLGLKPESARGSYSSCCLTTSSLSRSLREAIARLTQTGSDSDSECDEHHASVCY
eukprot:2313407-Rhodomonas_salina.1